jgi:hypothetical protein
MKNKYFERTRILQKEYGRKPQHLTDGIIIRHLYNSVVDPTIKTWWDDTGFMLNGVRISIWWTHPRNDFKNAVDEIAHKNVPYPECDDELDMFSDAIKIYKKVGKSGKRKKIIGYQTNNEVAEARKVWYEKLKAEESRLSATTDISITPSFKVESFDWCRGVSICVPIEVQSVDDLKTLCVLVRKLLLGQTTLDKEFPNYTYTKDDWANENKDGTSTGFFVHACKT